MHELKLHLVKLVLYIYYVQKYEEIDPKKHSKVKLIQI